MRKPDKKETVNLFFSAFLILAFIVCAHFFTQFTANLDATLGTIINICIYAVFGLLVFYATRVGDGKPVKRFSPVTLIVMVLPSLYIMIASGQQRHRQRYHSARGYRFRLRHSLHLLQRL